MTFWPLLFADDCKTLGQMVLKSYSDCLLFQHSQSLFHTRSSTWEFHFNLSKRKVIHFHSQSASHENHTYFINNSSIDCTNHHLNIGVTFLTTSLGLINWIMSLLYKALKFSVLCFILSLYSSLPQEQLLLHLPLTQSSIVYCC